MSNKVMKIAGKTPTNTVKGIAVDTDGKLMTKKEWQNDIIPITEGEEIRSTTAIAYYNNPIDLSEYGTVSLRIFNSLNADVVIGFYNDMNNTAKSSVMSKIVNGVIEDLRITVPANTNKWVIVTPEDIPDLAYFKKLALRIQALTEPTSGSLSVYAVGKR